MNIPAMASEEKRSSSLPDGKGRPTGQTDRNVISLRMFDLWRALQFVSRNDWVFRCDMEGREGKDE